MIFKLSELKGLIKSTINEALDTQNEEVSLTASKEDSDEDSEASDDVESDDEEEPEVSTIDDVPSTVPGLRMWLRDFVAPQIPLSQIPAFHRFVKLFLNKAKEMELKTREPSLKKRLGPDDEMDKKKAVKKEKPVEAPPEKKKKSTQPPWLQKKSKKDEEDEDEDEDK